MLLVCCCLTPGLYAQRDLSLSDAIEVGLRNNYDIQIVRANQEVAAVNNSWGAAGRYPSVQLNLRAVNVKDYNDNKDFYNQILTPSLDLNWVLFHGFSVRIRKAKFEELYRLSQGNTLVVVERSIQDIILVYYRVLLEREKLEVAEKIMQLSRDRYHKVKMGKELGSAITFEVLQAQNAWLNDKSSYLIQRVNVNNAVRDLNFLMGERQGITYHFTQEFRPDLTEYKMSDLLDEMLNNNSNLKNRYLQEALLEKEVILARRNSHPLLSINGGIQGNQIRNKFSGQQATTSQSYNLYANVSLSYTLFAGGIHRRAVQIAKIQDDIGQVQTQSLKHSLTNQLAQLFELYQVRRELYNLAQENLEAADLNLRISSDKYNTGSINSFNYRDVQIIYQNAAVARLNAIYNLVASRTALMRITGGILEE